MLSDKGCISAESLQNERLLDALKVVCVFQSLAELMHVALIARPHRAHTVLRVDEL